MPLLGSVSVETRASPKHSVAQRWGAGHCLAGLQRWRLVVLECTSEKNQASLAEDTPEGKPPMVKGGVVGEAADLELAVCQQSEGPWSPCEAKV